MHVQIYMHKVSWLSQILNVHMINEAKTCVSLCLLRRRMRDNSVGNNRDEIKQQRAVVGEDNPENDIVD